MFETDLGTLLLCARGLEENWHADPDGEAALRLLRDIDRSTLGQLLAKLRESVAFDETLTSQFASALKARNRLNHGFYERHNYAIQTEEGRDAMIADLETYHQELFDAWQVASKISTAFFEGFRVLRGEATGEPVSRSDILPPRPATDLN